MNHGNLIVSSSVSTNLSSLDEDGPSQATIHQEPKECFLTIKRRFITLTLNANGKADLYFHAYVWISILQSLYF
jgi:hypothetical protein